MDITIGGDPEIFLKKGGRWVSAHDLCPGTKANPHATKNGHVQVDGMALEVNIKPARTIQEFLDNVNGIVGDLRDIIPEEYTLVYKSVASFNPDYFDSVPDEPKLLGCSPDWNAWTGKENVILDQADPYFRTGSGHVAIGWTDSKSLTDKSHLFDCRAIVKALDHSLGSLSYLWEHTANRKKRRNLYGSWGAFRPTPFGVEYRVPTNEWLSDPLLIEWVFKIVKTTMMMLDTGQAPKGYAPTLNQEVWSHSSLIAYCDYHRFEYPSKELLTIPTVATHLYNGDRQRIRRRPNFNDNF